MRRQVKRSEVWKSCMGEEWDKMDGEERKASCCEPLLLRNVGNAVLTTEALGVI